MSSNSETVLQLLEEIKIASGELRELVYSAPTKWLWDTIGSAVSIEQIAETIEKIESYVKKIQLYCDEEFKEGTDSLIAIMWSGLQTKNNEAILQGAAQLVDIQIDFNVEPFKLIFDQERK